MSRPDDLDAPWKALEALRSSDVVKEARAYGQGWADSHRRSRLRGVALWPRFAAAAVVLAFAGTALTFMRPASMPTRDTFQTEVAEVKNVQLADGSRVQLNSDSIMAVTFTKDSRRIELANGEAHFEVAKDAARPFRVRAGGLEVVAIGTVFDVDALPSRTNVTLIEGRVEVHVLNSSAAHTPVETLLPGQQLAMASDGTLDRKSVTHLESVTAWQRGMIDLDDKPLGEALVEINRYARTKIAIADPSLASKHISGLFRTGDTDTIVSALEQFFGLKANRRSNDLVVLERR